MSLKIEQAVCEALCHPIRSQSAKRVVKALVGETLITGLFVFILAASLHFNGSALCEALSQRKALLLFGGSTLGFIGLFYIIFGPKKEISSPQRSSFFPPPSLPTPPSAISRPISLPPPSLSSPFLPSLSSSRIESSPKPLDIVNIRKKALEEELESLRKKQKELTDNLTFLEAQDREQIKILEQQIAKYQEAIKFFHEFPRRDVEKIQKRLEILKTYYPSIAAHCLEWPSIELQDRALPKPIAPFFDPTFRDFFLASRSFAIEEEGEIGDLSKQIDTLLKEISHSKKQRFRLHYSQYVRTYTLEQFQQKIHFQTFLNNKLQRLNEQLNIIIEELVKIEQALIDKEKNLLHLFSHKKVTEEILNKWIIKLNQTLHSFKGIVQEKAPPLPEKAPPQLVPLTIDTVTPIIISPKLPSFTPLPSPALASLSSSSSSISGPSPPLPSSLVPSPVLDFEVRDSLPPSVTDSVPDSYEILINKFWKELTERHLNNFLLSLLNLVIAICTKDKGKALSPGERGGFHEIFLMMKYEIMKPEFLRDIEIPIKEIIKNIYRKEKFKEFIRSKNQLTRLIFLAFNAKDFETVNKLLLIKMSDVETAGRIFNFLITTRKIIIQLLILKNKNEKEKTKIINLKTKLIMYLHRINCSPHDKIDILKELDYLKTELTSSSLSFIPALLKMVPDHIPADVTFTDIFEDVESFRGHLITYEGSMEHSAIYKIIARELIPLIFKAVAGSDFKAQMTTCFALAQTIEEIPFRLGSPKLANHHKRSLESEIIFNVERAREECVAYLHEESEQSALRDRILDTCIFSYRGDAQVKRSIDFPKKWHHLIPKDALIVPCSSDFLAIRMEVPLMGSFSNAEMPHKFSWSMIKTFIFGANIFKIFDEVTPEEQILKALIRLLCPSKDKFRQEILKACIETSKNYLEGPLEDLAMQEFNPSVLCDVVNNFLIRLTDAICPDFERYTASQF